MNIRFRKYINTAFILGPMTLMMACVGVMRNFGLHGGCAVRIMTTWMTMFPIAFLCGLVIIPTANKLTNKIKFRHQENSDNFNRR